jgi:hypothetical protein
MLTEEGYTRRVCPMQRVSVLRKVLGAAHELTHALQRSH